MSLKGRKEKRAEAAIPRNRERAKVNRDGRRKLEVKHANAKEKKGVYDCPPGRGQVRGFK